MFTISCHLSVVQGECEVDGKKKLRKCKIRKGLGKGAKPTTHKATTNNKRDKDGDHKNDRLSLYYVSVPIGLPVFDHLIRHVVQHGLVVQEVKHVLDSQGQGGATGRRAEDALKQVCYKRLQCALGWKWNINQIKPNNECERGLEQGNQSNQTQTVKVSQRPWVRE